MNVESDKRTYMKRIIFVMLMIAASLTGTEVSGKGRVDSGAVLGLVRTYNPEPGFEVISVGRLGLGLAKLVMSAEALDEEERATLELLRDINKVVVVNYDGVDSTKRKAFSTNLVQILDKAEKILEVKEEGEAVNIYGTSVNGGESIDDLMIFIPEDCTLVCILGSISAERIADLIEKANE